jgi:outer membrane protein insertion porin family
MCHKLAILHCKFVRYLILFLISDELSWDYSQGDFLLRQTLPKLPELLVTITVFLTLCFANTLRAANDLGPREFLFRVKDIQIKGLKKVEQEAVLEKMSVKPGADLDNYTLKRDLDRIYGLKFFESVEAHQENDILVISVKEKPIVGKIILKGNSEIDDDDLKEIIKTKEFSILDINNIKKDAVALQKHYEEKGYYIATVNFEVQNVSDENVNVTFSIKEFDKVRVKKILFLGNRAFSDDELKNIMETREESLFSFMSGAGNFKEFNFQTDIERIKYFYKTKGYLQVNVGSPEITVSEDKKWVFISMSLNEGPQFTVRDISFEGEILFPLSDLQQKISLKSEMTYSEELLRLDIQTLTEMYQDEGYAFANVLRTLKIVPGENKVDVEFSFEKGKIAYFGKITVKGNSKTRDKVVRRELLIKEGTKFSGSGLRISKENVNRLGFFEPNSVIFNTVTPKGKDDVLDVEISLKERNTGQISLGAGYSTSSKFFMQGSIAQNNFRGLGQNLSFRVALASKDSSYHLSFTEPYFFDTKWTAGFDIFLTADEKSEAFKEKRKGFDLRIGHPIAEYTKAFFIYKFEDTEISAVNDPAVNEDLENGVASSVEAKIIRDKRNNTFEPTDGYYLSLSTEYAGVGFSDHMTDKKWWRHEFDARYYYNLVGDLVMRMRLDVGKMEMVNDQLIPRSEKYFLGGARNMRGYGYDSLGPKGQGTKNGVTRTFSSRGLFSVFSTLELEHPLAKEAGLKWVVFADAGNIYEQHIGKNGDYDLRYDYGFGFRWFSPIGVLRFEFGFPINPPDGQGGSQFHFDIGQLF